MTSCIVRINPCFIHHNTLKLNCNSRCCITRISSSPGEGPLSSIVQQGKVKTLPSYTSSWWNHNIQTREISTNRTERGPSSYKFVDKARIRVTAGRGGNGCLSYATQMKSRYKKRPDGGHGGHGGYVILVADENEQSLNMQRHHFQAQDGKHGSSQQLHGRNGKDLIIRVPRGVVVKKILFERDVDNTWHHDYDDASYYSILQQKEKSHKYNNHRQGENLDDHEFIVYPERSMKLNKISSVTSQNAEEDASSQTDELLTKDDDKTSLSTKSGFTISYRTKRRQRRRKQLQKTHPQDYHEVVNTGEKSSEDGMYYWSSTTATTPTDEIDDHTSDTSHENQVEEVIADLDQAGSFVIVANGGKGGLGNSIYASRQFSDQHPSQAAKKSIGQLGESNYLELELKLIADIGLVGFPNAGKSSLLAAMSMAKPMIAPYPFTTLHPLVGCIEYKDGFRVLAADVPGLVAGASKGRGRGYDFLRHIERTKALLYIVDSAGVDGRDPVTDLKILFEEIYSYGDGAMIERPSLIVANKMDLIHDKSRREEIFSSLAIVAQDAGILYSSSIYGISAGGTGEGLTSLSRGIRHILENENFDDKTKSLVVSY